jgi:hypothetical protein
VPQELDLAHTEAGAADDEGAAMAQLLASRPLLRSLRLPVLTDEELEHVAPAVGAALPAELHAAV